MVIGEKFNGIEWNELTTFHAAKPGDVFGHGDFSVFRLAT
jgi:hypothetical protein